MDLIYLDIDEIAARYSVTTMTIRNWVRRERFPKPIKFSGGVTRWKLSDLEAWEREKEGNRG